MKESEYVEIKTGNLCLWIPSVEVSPMGLNNRLLWSLKEFDYKVFAYLDSRDLIGFIMKDRALSGCSFYDIDMDLYDATSYPSGLESYLKNSWTYAVMRQTYRYRDVVFPRFSTEDLAVVVSCEWNNNTRDALVVCPLQEFGPDYGRDMTIQFSSYEEYSEPMIENLLVSLLSCEKLAKDYVDFTPVKKIEAAVPGKHRIGSSNSFFYLEDGEIYCGMSEINPNILLKVDWWLFVQEMAQSKGCKSCNPGLKKRIQVPTLLDIFRHKLMKDYFSYVKNDCYSLPTQFLNLVHSQWKNLKERYPTLGKVILCFDPKELNTISVSYIAKGDHSVLEKRSLKYLHTADYILQEVDELKKLF